MNYVCFVRLFIQQKGVGENDVRQYPYKRGENDVRQYPTPLALPMNQHIHITLHDKDESISDPFAGFYTHYILIANGFMLAHFTHPNGRSAYKKYLQQNGFQGFPANIMESLFRYADPTKRTFHTNSKFTKPEQTGFVPGNHEKTIIPFRNYKVEICIYENIVFDLEIGPYVQYVVTCNDFVVASFTHLIGASAYVAYLKASGFSTFSKDVLEVIHFYADPSKRLKNVGKKEI